MHIVHCNSLHDGDEDEGGGGDVSSTLYDDCGNGFCGDGADDDCNFSSSASTTFILRKNRDLEEPSHDHEYDIL